MKKLFVAILVALMVSTVPVMASVAHVKADASLEELQIRLANGYGLTITSGDWIPANGAAWRKLYALQDGERIAILLQWEDRSGSWITVAAEKQQMGVAETIAYLQAQMHVAITRYGINKTSFGFRAIGLKKGDTIIVRQKIRGQRKLAATQVLAKDGWHWVKRRANVAYATVTVYHYGRIAAEKTIRF